MENQIDEEQALARLLGVGSGSPVATPEMLMRMAQWLHATLKREIDARPARGKQEWGRVSDIMEIYGANLAQVENSLLAISVRYGVPAVMVDTPERAAVMVGRKVGFPEWTVSILTKKGATL